MEIDRRLLIVDGPDAGLQPLALELMGREFGVHYARDLDEAQLLARDAHGKILAVLFSTQIELERIPDMARRLGVQPASLIPVGARPARRVIAALAFHGVRWHLWDDPPNESLRFVLSSLLYDNDPFEIRFHLRIPTNLDAQLEFAETKIDTTIRDISLGGACLFGGSFGEVGAVGRLHFSVDGNEIQLPTRLAWTSADENPDVNVSGVSFLEVEPEAGEAIDSLRRAFVARHRIDKPA